VDVEFGTGFMGAVTGTEGLRITHMLYADDLTLTANDPVQLQNPTYLILVRTKIPQFLFFVFTIRSLKKEVILPTWECYLIRI
jgi:hypothetical protein